VTFQVEN